MPPWIHRLSRLMLLLTALAGCRAASAPSPGARLQGEPLIRVRIMRQAERVTLGGHGKIRLTAARGTQNVIFLPATVTRQSGQWLVSSGRTRHPGGGVLRVEPIGTETLRVNQQSYPGALRLVPRAPNTFDVVNDVRIEAYLPGVLSQELPRYWHPATFRAQAIAARSYAIYNIIHAGSARHYDVESTTASQVYGGAVSHPRAIRAVRDTMGMVLTYDGEIIPAYYSSTCGGAGQSAYHAFGGMRIPPLGGYGPRQWCDFSPYYRWGPIERDRRVLSARLALWGGENGRPIARLGTIRAIEVAARNQAGRSVRFTVTDTHGHSYTLPAEKLRRACNFRTSALTPEKPNSRILSGYFQARVSGDKVIFHGRGFGHGVGLCQYGAEGMARAGYGPLRILAEYYPGAKVQRAY